MELSTILIWVPALVALIVIIAAYATASVNLGDSVGGLNWSFSGSWASNLTALMVLFTTLFALDSLPSDPLVAADDYTSLSVMFAAMVIVAPILFLLSANYSTGGGQVWGFLLAAVIILWAVIGQMATTFVLTLDLARSAIHGGVAAVLIGLSGLALVTATIHGIRSTSNALKATGLAADAAATALAANTVLPAAATPPALQMP